VGKYSRAAKARVAGLLRDCRDSPGPGIMPFAGTLQGENMATHWIARSKRLGGALLAGILLAATPALAQTWPNHPLKLVVPFPTAGTTDIIARAIAAELAKSLGQQVIVENRPGAGGNLGSDVVAKAAPDGYMLVMGTVGTHAINASLYANMPYDPVKDFAPVTLIATSPNVIAVNPAVPARTLADLVALIRATPGKYSFAGPGTGSSPHLSGELFGIHFNLDLPHVPFGGAAPAIGSTIAGHTPIAFTAVQPAIEAIKSGQLRALGVTSAKRILSLPDVPTLAESGVEGQEAESFNALLAPAGTPPHVVDILYHETARAVALPDVRDRLLAIAFDPVANTPAEFAAWIKIELARWEKVVRTANIKVE
jgi:tripartite-type tricarboxylate transporter receptor subunit TctC